MSSRFHSTFSVTDHRNTLNFNWVVNKNDKLAVRKLHEVQDHLLNIQSLPIEKAMISGYSHSEALNGPSKEARESTVEELRKLFGKCSTDISQEVKDWEDDLYERSVNNFHYGKLKRSNLAHPYRSKYCLEILDKENKNIADFKDINRNKQSTSAIGKFQRQNSVFPYNEPQESVQEKINQQRLDWSITDSTEKSLEDSSLVELSNEASTRDSQAEVKDNLDKDKSKEPLKLTEKVDEPMLSMAQSEVPAKDLPLQPRKSKPIPIVKPPGVPEFKNKTISAPNFTINPLENIRTPVPSPANMHNFPSLPPRLSDNTLKNRTSFGSQKPGMKPMAAIAPIISKEKDKMLSAPTSTDNTASDSADHGPSLERPVHIFDGEVHRYISVEELEDMKRNNKMFRIAILSNHWESS